MTLCWISLQATDVLGQGAPALSGASKQFPGPTFYLANDFFHDGQLEEAMSGYRESLRTCWQVGSARWVDSIPPIVMMGECYYQQGNIVSALEQYEAALNILVQNTTWMSRIQLQPTPNVASPANLRGINWGTNSRGTATFGGTGVVQCLFGQLDPNIALQTGGISLPPEVVGLDIASIQKAIALAIRRRNQILGPLVAQSPLTEAVANSLQQEVLQGLPWVAAGHSICITLSQNPAMDSNTAATLVQLSAIGNQDHPLTPIALSAAGEGFLRSGDFGTGAVTLIDASLAAAQLEQFDQLAEACMYLGHAGSVTGDITMATLLQTISAWSKSNSRMAYATALAHGAEVAATSNNLALSDQLGKAAVAAVRGRGVFLPRVTAQTAYASAVGEFSRGQIGPGLVALQSALSFYRGNAQNGPASRRLFQTTTVTDFYRREVLSVEAAEELLDYLILREDIALWRVEPLEALAQCTTNQQAAWSAWLELKFRRNKDEEFLAVIDRWQQQRFFDALPLSHRLLSWRTLLHSDPNQLPEIGLAAIKAAEGTFPKLAQEAEQLREFSTRVRQLPLSWDKSLLSRTDLADIVAYVTRCQAQEARLHLLSVSRLSMIPFVPPSFDLKQLRLQMADKDAVLLFQIVPAGRGQSVRAYWIGKETLESWECGPFPEFNRRITKLLADIGCGKNAIRKLDLQNSTAYRESSLAMRDFLLPENHQSKLASIERLVIVPCLQLWYVPWGLMPSDSQDSPVWSEKLQLALSPTLGWAKQCWQPEIPAKDIAIWGERFFAPIDDAEDSKLVDELVQAYPKAIRLPQVKEVAPLNVWKQRPDLAIFADAMEASNDALGFRFISLEKNKVSITVGDALMLPTGLPHGLFLPGWRTNAGELKAGTGDEVFLPACSFLSSGNQQLLLSLWPVGGRSTQTLLRKYGEEQSQSVPGEAWQRSLVSLWAENLSPADEPTLRNLPDGQDLLPGSHPLIWSGYLPIGGWLKAEPPMAAGLEMP